MDEKFDETVEEIINQIEVLGHRSSERVEHIDILESGSSLEEERAQEAYDEIRENTALESSANSFEGFEPTSSTPNRESESLTIGKVSSIIRIFEILLDINNILIVFLPKLSNFERKSLDCCSLKCPLSYLVQ